MRPETFKRAAQALYGAAWEDMMALDGAWSRRFVERVAAGQIEPHAYVGETVKEMLLERIETMNRIAEQKGQNETRRAKIMARLALLSEIADALDRDIAKQAA